MPFVQTRISSQFYPPFRVHPGRCNKRQSVFDTHFFFFFDRRLDISFSTKDTNGTRLYVLSFFRAIQTRNFRSMQRKDDFVCTRNSTSTCSFSQKVIWYVPSLFATCFSFSLKREIYRCCNARIMRFENDACFESIVIFIENRYEIFLSLFSLELIDWNLLERLSYQRPVSNFSFRNG